jgi:hypothetical protein
LLQRRNVSALLCRKIFLEMLEFLSYHTEHKTQTSFCCFSQVEISSSWMLFRHLQQMRFVTLMLVCFNINQSLGHFRNEWKSELIRRISAVDFALNSSGPLLCPPASTFHQHLYKQNLLHSGFLQNSPNISFLPTYNNMLSPLTSSFSYRPVIDEWHAH